MHELLSNHGAETLPLQIDDLAEESNNKKSRSKPFTSSRLTGICVQANPKIESLLCRFPIAKKSDINDCTTSHKKKDNVENDRPNVTHIISHDIFFIEYRSCIEAGIHVVTVSRYL